MGKAVITFKLMPDEADTDLGPIKEQAEAIARDGGAIGEMRISEEPIAFGLKSVQLLGMFEVEGSDFDGMTEKMAAIEGCANAEIAKMDLALG